MKVGSYNEIATSKFDELLEICTKMRRCAPAGTVRACARIFYSLEFLTDCQITHDVRNMKHRVREASRTLSSYQRLP